MSGSALDFCLLVTQRRNRADTDLVATAGAEEWLGIAQAFAGRAAPVKALLLDQRVVAGLGNIYVCEALHRAHIRPDRAGGSLSRAALARLVPAIRDVLTESIEAGGSTIRDYAQPNGELGYFASAWRVYGREGAACACGSPVWQAIASRV